MGDIGERKLCDQPGIVIREELAWHLVRGSLVRFSFQDVAQLAQWDCFCVTMSVGLQKSPVYRQLLYASIWAGVNE